MNQTDKPKRKGWNDSRLSSSIDSLEFTQIKKLKDMSLPQNKVTHHQKGNSKQQLVEQDLNIQNQSIDSLMDTSILKADLNSSQFKSSKVISHPQDNKSSEIPRSNLDKTFVNKQKQSGVSSIKQKQPPKKQEKEKSLDQTQEQQKNEDVIESSIKYLESRKQGKKPGDIGPKDKVKHVKYLNGLKLKEHEQNQKSNSSQSNESVIKFHMSDVLAVSKNTKGMVIKQESQTDYLKMQIEEFKRQIQGHQQNIEIQDQNRNVLSDQQQSSIRQELDSSVNEFEDAMDLPDLDSNNLQVLAGPVQCTTMEKWESNSESSVLIIDQQSNYLNDSATENQFSSLNTMQSREETEKQMVKYEADIRNHISIEQQLQIYIDSLKQKVEDHEKFQLKAEQFHAKQMQEFEDKKNKEMFEKLECVIEKLDEKEDVNQVLQESNKQLTFQLENYEKEAAKFQDREIDMNTKLDESQKREQDLVQTNKALEIELTKVKNQYKQVQIQLLTNQDQMIQMQQNKQHHNKQRLKSNEGFKEGMQRQLMEQQIENTKFSQDQSKQSKYHQASLKLVGMSISNSHSKLQNENIKVAKTMNVIPKKSVQMKPLDFSKINQLKRSKSSSSHMEILDKLNSINDSKSQGSQSARLTATSHSKYGNSKPKQSMMDKKKLSKRGNGSLSRVNLGRVNSISQYNQNINVENGDAINTIISQTQHQLNQSRMKQVRTSKASNLSQIITQNSNLNMNKTVSRSSLHNQKDQNVLSHEICNGGTGEQNFNLFGTKNEVNGGKKKLQTHFVKSSGLQNQKDKYSSNSQLFIQQIYDHKLNKKMTSQKQNSQGKLDISKGLLFDKSFSPTKNVDVSNTAPRAYTRDKQPYLQAVSSSQTLNVIWSQNQPSLQVQQAKLPSKFSKQRKGSRQVSGSNMSLLINNDQMARQQQSFHLISSKIDDLTLSKHRRNQTGQVSNQTQVQLRKPKVDFIEKNKKVGSKFKLGQPRNFKTGSVDIRTQNFD